MKAPTTNGSEHTANSSVRRSAVRPTGGPVGRPSTAGTRASAAKGRSSVSGTSSARAGASTRGGRRRGLGASSAGNPDANRSTPGTAPPQAIPATALTTHPGDLAADSMSITNRVAANSRCVALGEDGTVWTGEADGSIVIRLPPYGNELERIPADQPRGGRPPQVTVLHRVDDRMWAAYSNGTIKVFSTTPTSTGEITLLNENHQLTSVVYAMCDVNGHVYSAGADWKVYMYDAEDFHYERLLYGHKSNIRALTGYIDPESQEERVVSAGDDGLIKIWNPHAPSQKDKDVACVATIATPNNVGIWCAAAMQDTMELWVGCEDGIIRVYDLYSKSCSAEVVGHTAPVVALRTIDDNVWSGAKNGTLLIIDRYTKDVANVVRQPAGSTSGGGAGRLSICIQPVQRTIVNNVWVSSTDGSWQCWSQLSPESVVPASSSAKKYHSIDAVPDDDNGALGSSGAHEQDGSRSIKISTADDAHVTVAPGVDKDEALASKVANLRRTVDQLENESAPLAAAADEYPVEEDSDEDEAARLDLIEESIRRDRVEALESKTQEGAAADKEEEEEDLDEY